MKLGAETRPRLIPEDKAQSRIAAGGAETGGQQSLRSRLGAVGLLFSIP